MCIGTVGVARPNIEPHVPRRGRWSGCHNSVTTGKYTLAPDNLLKDLTGKLGGTSFSRNYYPGNRSVLTFFSGLFPGISGLLIGEFSCLKKELLTYFLPTSLSISFIVLYIFKQ